jgi:ElaB/YqjD/DUF883 family membrane-anchored ribosome-binding protein
MDSLFTKKNPEVYLKSCCGVCGQRLCNSISCEYRKFIADIDAVLASTNSDAADGLAEVNDRLKERVKCARESFERNGESILSKIKKSAEHTSEFVHAQPWKVIGGGVAAGALIGFVYSMAAKHNRLHE